MAQSPSLAVVRRIECSLWQHSLAELQVKLGISKMTAVRVRQGFPVSTETIAKVVLDTEYTFDQAFMCARFDARGPFEPPAGYKLVPIDPSDDDDPELAENKPVIVSPNLAPVKLDSVEPLPTTYAEALEDPRFTFGRTPNDNAIPEEELVLNPALGREAAILFGHDPDGGTVRLYAVEDDGTLRTWKALLEPEHTAWVEPVIEAVMGRFDLTEQEVRSSIRSGMFTERRVESIKRKRES